MFAPQKAESLAEILKTHMCMQEYTLSKDISIDFIPPTYHRENISFKALLRVLGQDQLSDVIKFITRN